MSEISLKNSQTNNQNLWVQLETKPLTKQEIEQVLTKKLGQPPNQLSSNCLTELTKKISSYYYSETPKNFTVFSLVDSLTSPEQITEKRFKEGKRLGQTFYTLQIGKERLQAVQENLPPKKWQQIRKMAIIGQNLVFKYKKWITNKELLDFYPYQKEEPTTQKT